MAYQLTEQAARETGPPLLPCVRRARPNVALWTCVLSLLFTCSRLDAGIVSGQQALLVADGFCRQAGIVAVADSMRAPCQTTGLLPFEDLDGRPGAFLCELSTGDGEAVTVIVGARTDLPPVLRYHTGPADCLDAARAVAARKLGTDSVQPVGAVYYSPLDLWLEYEAGERRILVSLRDLSVCTAESVRNAEPISHSASGRTGFEEQWHGYLSGGAGLPQDGQNWIPDVPDWDWHYGCAPTAAANVLSYWDRGGYWLLVDSVRKGIADPIEGDIDDVPNVSRQLAVAMGTDTIVSGRTVGSSIPAGIAAVCDDPSWNNEYDFTSYLAWDDHDLLVSEIESGRPGVLVLTGHPNYGCHAVTYCGWGPPSSDWIMVHDVWGGEPQDVVFKYNHGAPVGTIPVIPGGGAEPDVTVEAITRPADRTVPGRVEPAVTVANLGGSSSSVTVHLRVERPGGGFSESFERGTAFPPERWLHHNADGNPSHWDVGATDSGPDGGHTACLRESPELSNDDWFVTPKVRVNSSDTLGFRYRALGQEPESLEILVSFTDARPESFTRSLKAIVFQNQNYEDGWAGFDIVGDTTVHVGFRYFMPAGRPGSGVCLDEIELRTVYYSDERTLDVAPGQSAPVGFSPWRAWTGHYVVRCSVDQAGDCDSANNTSSRDFQICAAEDPRPLATGDPRYGSLRVLPSPADRVISGVGWRGPATASVFDATGRRVMHSRVDDADRIELPRLPAGVYLLRLEGAGSPPATSRFMVAR